MKISADYLQRKAFLQIVNAELKYPNYKLQYQGLRRRTSAPCPFLL